MCWFFFPASEEAGFYNIYPTKSKRIKLDRQVNPEKESNEECVCGSTVRKQSRCENFVLMKQIPIVRESIQKEKNSECTVHVTYPPSPLLLTWVVPPLY